MDAMTTMNSTLGTLVGSREGPSWLIRARGEFDLSTAPAIEDAFASVPASCDRIILDLSGVTFVDCSGLRALETASAGCGREVSVRAPSRPVRRLARLVGANEAQWRPDQDAWSA